MAIQIKDSDGDLLFECEAASTIKEALQEAVKKKTDLRGAYLRGADLEGADLEGAYLEGADLEGAYLRGADLEGAYLRGADLEGADLRGADLRGAKNLPASYVNQCSRDMLYIFRALKSELPFLREKLITGKINGSKYEGECCCLVGSLAQAKSEDIDRLCSSLPYYDKGLHNFAEQWFWQIKQDDLPENNIFAKHALDLIDLVLAEK